MVERRQLDLMCLVEHYRTVQDHLWLPKVMWDLIASIWRWDDVGLTVLVMSLTALLILFPRILVALIISSILVSVLAGLFSAQTTHSAAITTSLQGQLLNEDTQAMKNCRAMEERTESALQEYRMLIQMIDMVFICVIDAALYFKSVLFWMNTRLSLGVIVICLVGLMLLIRGVSLSLVLSVLVIVMFCSSPHFIVCCKQRLKLHIPSRNFVAKLLPILRSTEMDPVVATETEEQSENNEERLMSSNETEGFCFQCRKTFTLKKNQCSICGHLFCDSCSVKVPRSYIGATSPSAQSETVSLCLECKQQWN